MQNIADARATQKPTALITDCRTQLQGALYQDFSGRSIFHGRCNHEQPCTYGDEEEMSEEPTILPDGSAFFTASFPLPQDHWLYERDEQGFYPPPPMSFRMTPGPDRDAMADKIREAVKYAVRASTMGGQDNDFDPDALMQNMVVGMLGYFTDDGLGCEDWENPEIIPPLHAWEKDHP